MDPRTTPSSPADATSSEPPTVDEVQAQVRAQEAVRMRAQEREQVRREAWAAMRAQFRFAVLGTALLCLLVGGLVGFYGLRGLADRDGPELAPPARWAAAPLTPPVTAVGAPLPVVATPWPLRVYVSGAVVAPGVVDLPSGSLVADALDAAGGPTSDADLDGLNLAAALHDNQHVLVSRLTSRAAPVSGQGAAPGATPTVDLVQTPLNINTATVEQLQSLPGIGPARAQDIVSFRQANGPFAQPEDLMAVPGIGPATYERLAPIITVGP